MCLSHLTEADGSIAPSPSRHVVAKCGSCPEWCLTDHDGGKIMCRSESRTNLRIPWREGSEASRAHLFSYSSESETMMVINGQAHSLTAASQYAREILELVDEGTPTDPGSLEGDQGEGEGDRRPDRGPRR